MRSPKPETLLDHRSESGPDPWVDTFVVITAADELLDKTTVPNHFWQTDLIYLKAAGRVR